MDSLDKIAFAARGSLWRPSDADAIKRVLAVKRKEISLTNDQNLTVTERFAKTKSILDEYKRLREDGVKWGEEEDYALYYGDATFKAPPDINEKLEEIYTHVDARSEEKSTKRRKIKQFMDHLKFREEYLMEFPFVLRTDLAPEYKGGLEKDPILTSLPEGLISLRAWSMDQFFDVTSTSSYPPVWEAKRLSGNFKLYQASDDEQAANMIRAGQFIPSLRFEGAFRAKDGKMVVAVRHLKGYFLKHIGRSTKMVGEWLFCEILRKLCNIIDSLASLGLKHTDITKNLYLLRNGDLYLMDLHLITKLQGNEDNAMIQAVGALTHCYYAKREHQINSYGIPSIHFKEPQEAVDFVKRALISGDGALKHPVSKTSFVNSYPKHPQRQRPPTQDFSTEHLFPQSVRIAEICLPKQKEPYFVTQTRLIKTILEFCSKHENPDHLVQIIFEKQDGIISDLGRSHFTEAWKGLFECHSLWEAGPNGFFLASGKEYCLGCQSNGCSLANPTSCGYIGKWLANTFLSRRAVPYPIDPLLMKIITQNTLLIENMTAEEANREYERLLDQRETMVFAISGAFTCVSGMNKFRGLAVGSYMGRLFGTLIDREHLLTQMTFNVSTGDCHRWFLEWIRSCEEGEIRAFLMEISGTVVIREKYQIFFAQEGTRRDIEICACSTPKKMHIPSVKDESLFKAMLHFSGPYFFHK